MQRKRLVPSYVTWAMITNAWSQQTLRALDECLLFATFELHQVNVFHLSVDRFSPLYTVEVNPWTSPDTQASRQSYIFKQSTNVPYRRHLDNASLSLSIDKTEASSTLHPYPPDARQYLSTAHLVSDPLQSIRFEQCSQWERSLLSISILISCSVPLIEDFLSLPEYYYHYSDMYAREWMLWYGNWVMTLLWLRTDQSKVSPRRYYAEKWSPASLVADL